MTGSNPDRIVAAISARKLPTVATSCCEPPNRPRRHAMPDATPPSSVVSSDGVTSPPPFPIVRYIPAPDTGLPYRSRTRRTNGLFRKSPARPSRDPAALTLAGGPAIPATVIVTGGADPATILISFTLAIVSSVHSPTGVGPFPVRNGALCSVPSPFVIVMVTGTLINASPAEFRTTNAGAGVTIVRSEEHTSELQSPCNRVCRPLLEKKK